MGKLESLHETQGVQIMTHFDTIHAPTSQAILGLAQRRGLDDNLTCFVRNFATTSQQCNIQGITGFCVRTATPRARRQDRGSDRTFESDLERICFEPIDDGRGLVKFLSLSKS